MINIDEAQELIEKFIALRKKMKETNLNSDKLAFQKHEAICIEKFKYLVTMRTGKYKSFSNYEDLNQEGMEALIKAMKNYNPKKGNFFWWSHRYVETRIARSANLHTAIRYPLKVARETPPHKETSMPLVIENIRRPDKELETSQVLQSLNNVIDKLSSNQKEIINFAFGLDGNKPLSINKICKKLNISRLNCIKIINGALSDMKENIQI